MMPASAGGRRCSAEAAAAAMIGRPPLVAADIHRGWGTVTKAKASATRRRAAAAQNA